MSRSGYTDDDSEGTLGLWRGAVRSAMNGKRGQALFRRMLAALDAMPVKELYPHELVENGRVCALGAVGVAEGIDLTNVEPTEPDEVAEAFNAAPALVQEIVYMNDEWGDVDESPAQRHARMRLWVAQHIHGPTPAPSHPERSET